MKGSDCVIEGGERTLRLAYSGVSPAEIAEGMERLGAVFRGSSGHRLKPQRSAMAAQAAR